jgi:hypothetical protein
MTMSLTMAERMYTHMIQFGQIQSSSIEHRSKRDDSESNDEGNDGIAVFGYVFREGRCR